MSESAGSNKEKSYEDITSVQPPDTEVGKASEIVNSDDQLLREIGYKQVCPNVGFCEDTYSYWTK